MFKCFTAIFLSFTFANHANIEDIFHEKEQKIVLQTRTYKFEKYPQAFNPSLFQIDQGFILTFRYTPDEENEDFLSHIGIVTLDESLNPIEEPQLLNTRPRRSKTPSQSEDARIFSYRGKLFVIYNDNVDEIFLDSLIRRDMFMAELIRTDNGYQLSIPMKLYHDDKYAKFLHQKNWIPFEWNKKLYMSYSLFPHEVLEPNLKNGACHPVYQTQATLNWNYGTVRGGTPPLLVDGEYLAFFHSGIKMASESSYNWKIWHYFMGAYTFSAEPPFEITKATEKPIISDEFYTLSYRPKRVIFPGGFVVCGPHIYVAYGKDDCEICIATLDKDELKRALVPVAK